MIRLKDGRVISDEPLTQPREAEPAIAG
jgi:hypothetical protein